MVSPGSSRTSAGPPTSTSPVYVEGSSGLRSESVGDRRYGPGMDASGAPATAQGPGTSSACRRPRSPAGALGRGDGGRRRPRAPRPHRGGRRPDRRLPRPPQRGRAGRGRRRRRRAHPGSPCRWPASRSRSRTTSPWRGRCAPTARPRTAVRRRPADHPVVARLRKAGAVVVGITRVPELCLYGATDGPGTVSRNPWDTALLAGRQFGRQRRRGRRRAACRSPTATTAWARCGSRRGLRAGHAQAGARRGAGRDRCRQLVGHGRERRPGHHRGRPGRRARGPGGGGARPARRRRTGRCGSRSPPGRRCPASVPTRPTPGRGRRGRGPAGRRRAHRRAPRTRRSPPAPRGRAGAVDGRRRRRRRSTSALDRRPCSRAAAPTPGSGGWCAGRAWSGRARQQRFRERMVGFFDDVDVLLTPVTTGPPLAARPWHERSFLANVTANARWAPWTAAWNLAGLPALVLPAGSRPDGLPRRRPVRRPPGRRERLLWLAGELERRQPVAPLRARLRPHRATARRPPSAALGDAPSERDGSDTGARRVRGTAT